ncbi:MAG: carbohydrate-binding family 9-like protein [Phycisphaerae bacterium]|nr:carbohydrate-binding family 9-like protein [Phycisphaerae bacterium]
MISRQTIILALCAALTCVASISCVDQNSSDAVSKDSAKPPLPTINCYRATGPGPIQLDGLINESAWEKAQTVKLQLNNGTPPRYATTVRVLWDDTYLYMAFDCEDPQPSASFKKHDQPLWEQGNVVEAFINPAGKGRKYYEFQINPLNTKIDLWIDLTRESGLNWKINRVWNAEGWRSAVNIRRKSKRGPAIGWSVETAIPLKNFKTSPHQPPKIGDVWRINFYRYNTIMENDVQKQKAYAWSPTYGGFHKPSMFGYMRFK